MQLLSISTLCVLGVLATASFTGAFTVPASPSPPLGAILDAIPCNCESKLEIIPKAGYTVSLYRPGTSDDEPACSDWDPDNEEGCVESPINECILAGDFTITETATAIETEFNMIDDMGGLNWLECGQIDSANAMVGTTTVATVTAQCTNCQI